MLNRLLRPLRESFSAKIIALVVASVAVTSVVVGIVTMRSTQRFLADKTCEKFPAILSASKSKVRILLQREVQDLERLSQSSVFLANLERYFASGGARKADSSVQDELHKYLRIVQIRFPIYDEILVLAPGREAIAFTSAEAAAAADSVVRTTLDEDESSRFCPAIVLPDRSGAYQWLFVPFDSPEFNLSKLLMVAKVDLGEFGREMAEIGLDRGGDLYLVDEMGRYLTQPRFAEENLVGLEAMQVPTRDDGQLVVEERTSYGDRLVFRSISRVEETGWWVVHEEDYTIAMEPVLNTQTRIWVAVLLIGAAFVLAALKVVQTMLRPVRALALGAQRINEGLVGVKIPRGANDEIGMMIGTFNEMAQTITLSKAELQYKNKMLNQQNDQLQDMNRRLEELSVTDGLTGLFNHRHFWNILNTELARVHLYKGNLALVLIDLDDFKRVNDQFGHAVGDLLLQSIARLLKEAVRETDIVARYGGEEFAILLPDTNRSGVEQVSEKLRRCVEALRFKIPETDIAISVTISIGVSVFRGNRREFFNAADRALYLSKSEGKNRVNYALQS